MNAPNPRRRRRRGGRGQGDEAGAATGSTARPQAAEKGGGKPDAEPRGNRQRSRDGDRRGGGGERGGGRDRRRGPDAAAPISAPRSLDLERPIDEPLAGAELREMKEHLQFLGRFKAALRLSLNAAEALLVNGARPPTDRGQCRHLLAKVDRPTVRSALDREPLRSDRPGRLRFLAGVVRLVPDVDLLLEYLSSVTEVAERREAARAFAATVDKVDLAGLSPALVTRLLEVVRATFTGPDRVQALFGLLDNPGAEAAIGGAMPDLSPELIAQFGPLTAAHRVVVRGEAPPRDDEDRGALDRGLAILLDAPASVLRSYSEPTRLRLATLALDGELEAREAIRTLIASLPEREDTTALRIARARQLLASGEDDEARSVLNRLAHASPPDPWAERRAEAMSWPRVGRVATDAGRPGDGQLHRGFWLDGAAFAWVRTAPPEQAGRVVAAARLASDLCTTGVIGVLGHGLGDKGLVWIAHPLVGSPKPPRPGSLASALDLAADGLALLADLARAGVEMPDLELERLRWIGGPRPRPLVLDLLDARPEDPSRAALAHGPPARAWCRRWLADRDDLPGALRTRLAQPAPLVVLARTLMEHRARLDDR